MITDKKKINTILRFLFYAGWFWVVGIFLFGLINFFFEGEYGLKKWYNTYVFRWYNYVAFGAMFLSAGLSMLLVKYFIRKKIKDKVVSSGSSNVSSLSPDLLFIPNTDATSVGTEIFSSINHSTHFAGYEGGDGGGAGAGSSWDHSTGSEGSTDSSSSDSGGGDSGSSGN